MVGDKDIKAQSIYVYTVCGSKEEIDKLHFSLKCLKKVTSHSIVVITDLKRNEIKINHNWIVNADIPNSYSNRDASRILKTGIHKFLDLKSGTKYCYLDNDVVVLSSAFNSVFDIFNYKTKILFSEDISLFFESCNNNFLQNNYGFISELEKKIRSVDAKEFFKYTTTQKWMKLFFYTIIKFSDKYDLPTILRLLKLLSSDGSPVVDSKLLSRGVYFSYKTNSWKLMSGETIIDYRSTKPAQQINKQFNANISLDWKIRNSGVYLFGAASIPFLESWNKKMYDCINTHECLSFDQTMLAITLDEFGLLNDNTLPIEYNFLFTPRAEKNYISDYNFKLDNSSIISPYAIHFYRSWMNTKLKIWKEIFKNAS